MARSPRRDGPRGHGRTAHNRRPSSTGHGDQGAGWRHHRRGIRFVALFALFMAGSFGLLAWTPVNDHLVEPLTAGIAGVSGFTLNLLGQDVARTGTVLRSRDFAVSIHHGCNGVEAMVIFLAAVLAFPAPWRGKLVGLALGIVVIQAVNLVRVVALFLTGAHLPALFDASHTVIWQTVVILSAVILWLFWASRIASARPSEAS
jgi:exosortase H (IPTLxxWG-CTERM-specific)